MMTWILIVALIAVLFWYFAIRPFSYWTKRGIPQGNPRWLLGDNGTMFLKLESFAEIVIRLYRERPKARYSGIYQFTTPILQIRDPNLLKQITVKDFDYFVDHRTLSMEEVDPLWGKNLLFLKGQRWKEMRPILSPSFTSSKMKLMFVLISECAEAFVKNFLSNNQDVIEVEMKDIFTRFGNDVIATTAFGIKVDSLAEPNNQFYLMGKEVTNFSGFWRSLKLSGLLLMPKLYKLLKIGLFGSKVRSFFINLIDESIKIREEQKILRSDMIHLLLEARKGNNNKHEENGLIDTGFATVEEANIGKIDVSSKTTNITNLDIAAQALIFFFAGFESVATFMCFMAYELALHPEIQDRLRREIELTKEKCGEKLNYESLMKMKYMDMIVSETLRKWPNNVATDRVCTKPYTIEPQYPDEKPVKIEKGDLLWLPIFGLHHDPKYYPDPEKFDPERFNDENKSEINPYTYLPFGLGPRNCIGSRFALLEAKILFFYLLSNFEIVPIKKTVIPIKISKRNIQLTVEGGFNLGLKRLVQK